MLTPSQPPSLDPRMAAAVARLVGSGDKMVKLPSLPGLGSAVELAVVAEARKAGIADREILYITADGLWNLYSDRLPVRIVTPRQLQSHGIENARLAIVGAGLTDTVRRRVHKFLAALPVRVVGMDGTAEEALGAAADAAPRAVPSAQAVGRTFSVSEAVLDAIRLVYAACPLARVSATSATALQVEQDGSSYRIVTDGRHLAILEQFGDGLERTPRASEVLEAILRARDGGERNAPGVRLG